MANKSRVAVLRTQPETVLKDHCRLFELASGKSALTHVLGTVSTKGSDAGAAKLMGFEPMNIAYIRLAHERGLGVGDIRQIELVGAKALLKKPKSDHKIRT